MAVITALMSYGASSPRFGKYRPHMIMGVLLWAVIMVMLFTVPSLPETGMWIYYIIALLLYSVFYTQFTVPCYGDHRSLRGQRSKAGRLL